MQRLGILILCVALVSVAYSGMPGGRRSHHVTSQEVKDIAAEVVAKLNHQTNSMYHRRLGHVIHVESQVVAGMLWRLDFIWGDTTCKKSMVPHYEDVTEDKCPFNAEGKVEHCYVKYLVMPWEGKKTLERVQCKATDRDELVSHDAHALLKKELMLKTNSLSEVHELTKVHLHKINKERYLYTMDDFEDYIQLFGKQYADRTEKMKRFGIFQTNMWIARQLQKHEKGSATYGATPFTDMSLAEFRKSHLNPRWRDIGYPTEFAEIPRGTPPASFDWRQHNAVTPVKNQGSCGSCWAFSTTGNIEGQWAVKKGKLVSLSEQELVDCDRVDQGCNGGLPSQAYQAIMRLGGLETEEEYPYDGRGEKCTFEKSDVAVYINGSVKISQNETDMAAWLAKNGPISIGINAMPMMWYLGGIAHPWKFMCNPKNLDHGVLIVGYGTSDKGEPFWIIKNSWGPSWGRDGYYYVYRGDGTCGLNTMATSAVIR